ncbi:OmpA family protein [Nonlabens agnitus]|nr:OmpA family protein [Nonlabens agnitus]
MKSFLIGLLVFLFYAALCVVLLSYAMDTYSIKENSPEIVGENEIDPKTIDDLSYEDSTDLGSSVTSELDEVNNDSINNSLQNSDNVDADGLTDSDAETDGASIENINRPAIPFNVVLPNGTQLIQCNSFSVVFQDQVRVKIPYACRDYGISINSFLDKNPQSILRITGYTDPNESPNTGIGRAEYLKKLLTNTGIPADRIIATSAVNNLNFSSGSANGGVAMEINGSFTSNPSSSQTADNESNPALDNPKESTTVIASKKFTSGFQEKYFYGDQKFTAYATTIKSLLNQNPSSKVYAYSYTDSEGDSKDNFAISRDNASTVRKILLQSGIPSNRIQSVARGEQNAGGSGSNLCIILVIK